MSRGWDRGAEAFGGNASAVATVVDDDRRRVREKHGAVSGTEVHVLHDSRKTSKSERAIGSPDRSRTRLTREPCLLRAYAAPRTWLPVRGSRAHPHRLGGGASRSHRPSPTRMGSAERSRRPPTRIRTASAPHPHLPRRRVPVPRLPARTRAPRLRSVPSSCTGRRYPQRAFGSVARPVGVGQNDGAREGTRVTRAGGKLGGSHRRDSGRRGQR